MASIKRQTTVVCDGYHNAFTDLAYWQGCYWTSYRKGSAHVSMDGEVCLSVSADRTRFREAARLKVPGDNRDPKLVAMNDGRLAMLFPSWVGGYAALHLQQFIAFSHDGFNWSEPLSILEPHWWLWRVVEYQGRYYGAAYTYRDAETGGRRVRQRFMVSDDMLRWETLGQTGEDSLSESDFRFRPDGEVWMISRCSEPPTAPAHFCTSRPPYTEWETRPLDVMIHSPAMLEHDGALYVAGRRHAPQEGDATFPFESAMSLGIWRVERNRALPVLRIPAGGDCAYPGFIKDPEGRICLTYYSQHATLMGLALAEHTAMLSRSEVYFAELELP